MKRWKNDDQATENAWNRDGEELLPVVGVTGRCISDMFPHLRRNNRYSVCLPCHDCKSYEVLCRTVSFLQGDTSSRLLTMMLRTVTIERLL